MDEYRPKLMTTSSIVCLIFTYFDQCKKQRKKGPWVLFNGEKGNKGHQRIMIDPMLMIVRIQDCFN